MSAQKVSVFGIGNMGAALAKALVSAGNKVTVWNRTADREQVHSVVNYGAVFEGELRKAMNKSDDVLLFCVVDYGAMYALLEPLSNSDVATNPLAGKTVINVTNGTPKQAGEMSAWFKARSVARYLDGSVLVTPEMIAGPAAMLIFSGENADVFEKHARPVVSALGHPLYYGSRVGAAAAQDLAMLAAMYGMFQGAMVGFGILQRAAAAASTKETADNVAGASVDGGSGDDVIKVTPGTDQVTTPVMGALAPLLTRIARRIDAQSYTDNEGNPLQMMLAGLENILAAAEDLGVDGDGLAVLADAMRKAVDDGWGNGNFAVTSKYLLR